MDFIELNNKEVTEQQEKEKGFEDDEVIAEIEVQDEDFGDQEPTIGKITFVSCATGSSYAASDTSTNKGNVLVRWSKVNELMVQNLSWETDDHSAS